MSRIFDTEKVKYSLKKNLALVKQECLDPKIIELIEIAENNVIQEINDNIKFIVLDAVTKQRFMYLLAGATVQVDERESWFLYHAIMSVFSMPEIEELLKERYGDNYYTLRKKLFSFGAKIEKINIFLNHMDEKTLKDNDVKSESFKRLMKLLEELPLIHYDLYHILITILIYTNLGKNAIPSTAFQIFERKDKKVQYSQDGRDRGDRTFVNRDEIGG